MLVALAFTFGSIACFFSFASFAGFIARRHHYYEDPDEDQKGVHH